MRYANNINVHQKNKSSKIGSVPSIIASIIVPSIIKNIVMVVLICSLSFMIECQADDSNNVYSNLERFLLQNQNKEVITIMISEDQLKQGNPDRLLNSIDLYIKSEDVTTKSLAISLIFNVAKLHPTREVRQKVTRNLVEGLISNKEIDASFRWKYDELISEFSQDSFSENSKALLIQNLDANHPSKEIIRACGVAQIKNILPQLNKIIVKESQKENKGREWYYTTGWTARLARARMGIKEDVQECVSQIEQEIDKNGRFQLLDKLGYIRQPESIEILKKYFLSDLVLPPTNPGMDGESYSKYLMPILDENLSNFPVKKNINQKLARIYSKEEIVSCRKWMSEQKEWQIIR